MHILLLLLSFGLAAAIKVKDNNKIINMIASDFHLIENHIVASD